MLRTDKAEAVNDRERLDEALQDPEALSNLKIASDMKFISKTTPLLVKMRPTEGFGRFAVNISSDHVAQELAKRNRADNARELWKAMRAGMLTGTGTGVSQLHAGQRHQEVQASSTMPK